MSIWIAFGLFAGANILAAIFSPIQDCDEVFNYWEPSHYLNHGSGFQTWEYSPEYGIRSWAYASIHSTVITVFRILTNSSEKASEFYALRIFLGLICATCETHLFQAVQSLMGNRVAFLFLLIISTSTGMFHATVAYLPSSFAMYTAMLGAASFMNWQKQSSVTNWITWFAVGAIVGWPFAAALALPFAFTEVVLSIINSSIIDLTFKVANGLARSILILVFQTGVDAFFYRKITVVPWNIVAYNVFSNSSKGPDIYGTESWDFYLRNLVLNFGIWFPIAALGIPVVLVQAIRGRFNLADTFLRTLTCVSPFYVWLAIFTLQPHKEERFMYPIYPFLALNSAVSIHVLLQILGSIPKIPPMLKFVTTICFFASAIILSLLRTGSLASGYTAPLRIYSPLSTIASPGDTVCLGKEWYRFPSSYLLPEGVKAKFIKSAFAGLIPGEFDETPPTFEGFPGAYKIPSGMNDENKEDPGKYTDISKCTFLVDSYFPSTSEPSNLEPNYIHLSDSWDIIRCEKFLDASATGIFGRLFWIPNYHSVPSKFKRNWAEYCLLKRK